MSDHPSSKRQRKRHQKSRSGCVTCKRRKIKCDEGKPVCNNCSRFQVPCGYSKPGELVVLLDHSAAANPARQHGPPCSPPPRRKPGRPRKVWTTRDISAASGGALKRWLESRHRTPPDPAPYEPSLEDLELLLHFTKHTAPTLALFIEPGAADLEEFWSYNAPRIGLASPYVLHLLFSLSARHMLFLELGAREERDRLLGLAERHVACGVADMSPALSSLDESNCSTLYLASLLVCFYTFAAGPTGPNDLLVTSTADLRPQASVPLIRGVRLIRQAFPLHVLFTGLFAPLDRNERDGSARWRPRWVDLNLPRLSWEAPLGRLRELVASRPDSDETGRSYALDVLEGIYETQYGRSDGGDQQPAGQDLAHRFVLCWIYRVNDSFLESLQQNDDVSLLILAHFAPLLQIHQDTWFLRGWTEQLVLGARALLSPWSVSWLQWPLEAAGLMSSESSPGWDMMEGEPEGLGDAGLETHHGAAHVAG